MKKTKNKVIKIRIVPIILIVLAVIIFCTLAFTNTMEQIGVRINNNNTIREVQAGDVAKISRDGKEYGFSSLEEAIEEVKDKETIVILENVNLDNALTINKNITISGSECIITTKGITNTADLTIQDVTITDAETEETIAINNTGKLYLKSVTLSNINGTGIKNTGTLVFKNIQTTITAKNAIDGKVNEVPSTYGLKIIKSSNNPQNATIISEATASSDSYELVCGNIFYKMSEIVDTVQDENNVLIKQDIFDNGNCEFKILKYISVTYDKPIKIQNGESVSINLNNKEMSINLNRMPSMFSNSGKLKLENGSLTKSSSYTCAIENEGELDISNITLNSGTANRSSIWGSGGTVNIKGKSNLIMQNKGPEYSSNNRWNL